MLIARSAGVSVREVRRVTDGQGPFPRSRHTRSLAVGKDTVQEWVARRRAGESAASIARTEKLSARLVRERLAPHEPREGPGTGLMGINDAAPLLRLPSSTIAQWSAKRFLPEPATGPETDTTDGTATHCWPGPTASASRPARHAVPAPRTWHGTRAWRTAPLPGQWNQERWFTSGDHSHRLGSSQPR